MKKGLPVNDTNQHGDMPTGREGQPGQKGPIIPKSANEALRPERVPEPPKRSRKARSQMVIFLNFLMTLVVFVFGLGILGFYYVISTYNAPGPLTTNTNFIVRGGAGLSEIATRLENSNIISDARVFRYLTGTHLHDGETLKAGEYEIKAGASMNDIMELMKSGKSILYSVSMPEGLTVRQMFNKLQADPILEGELPSALPAEGALRPDTYKFSRGTKRSEILSQMRAAQLKMIDQIWEKRDPDLPIKTKEDFLVLASIVEKETGKADERSRVAAVFANRLRQKMKLQSDPTIIYGIVGGKGTLGRPIKRSEITQPSPYNTYVVEGLPPGPIANPGRASMEATAKPARTRDLFFVADGTGGHSFTETYDAHQKNVVKLRAMEKAIQNDSVEPPEETAAPAAAVPADANGATGATGRPVAPAKQRARNAAPAPARQGAAQTTTTPPVVQQ